MKIACVITKENLQQQIKIIKKYKNYIYAVEVRIDTFYPDKEKINKILEFLHKNFPKIKKIITFRKFSEGGKIKIGENQRKNFLISVITNNSNYIDYVDIELNSKIKNRIIKYIKEYKKVAILSAHYLANHSISLPKLKKHLKEISKYVKLQKINCIIKVVIKINNFKQYFNFLKVIYNLNNKNITFFTTGKTSLTSRSIGVLLDMPLVYVATKSPVIASQPDISTFLKTLRNIGYIA